MNPSQSAICESLELLFQQRSGHALMLLDPSGRITTWFAGAERVFGYSAEEVIGQPSSILFLPEDVARGIPEHEVRVALTNGAAENDRWLLRKDGARFWAVGMLIPIRRPDGAVLGFGKILRNLTSLKTELENWKSRLDEAESLRKRQTIMISQLAHEFRNTLMPLQTAGEMLKLDPQTLDTAFVGSLLQRQVDFMTRLINDLLDQARLQSGKVELRYEQIELQDLLQNCLAACRPQITEREQHVELLVPSASIVIPGDRDRLQQVFVNLISNASKYTPARGRIWVKGTIEDTDAVIRVEDNGIGIPTEVLPKIFELFAQEERARRQAPSGLGIGLALVKGLVDLHGGQVLATSNGRDRGSEFTVRLPLARRNEAMAQSGLPDVMA